MQKQIIEGLKHPKEQPVNQNFSFEKEIKAERGCKNEPFLDINKDAVLSGSHLKAPNTVELSQEYSVLEKSIGKVSHNRTISIIDFPSCHKRIESVIHPNEVFNNHIDY